MHSWHPRGAAGRCSSVRVDVAPLCTPKVLQPCDRAGFCAQGVQEPETNGVGSLLGVGVQKMRCQGKAAPRG